MEKRVRIVEEMQKIWGCEKTASFCEMYAFMLQSTINEHNAKRRAKKARWFIKMGKALKPLSNFVKEK